MPSYWWPNSSMTQLPWSRAIICNRLILMAYIADNNIVKVSVKMVNVLTRQFGHELGTTNAMELMAKIFSLPEKLDASGLWGLYSISYFFLWVAISLQSTSPSNHTKHNLYLILKIWFHANESLLHRQIQLEFLYESKVKDSMIFEEIFSTYWICRLQ